MTYISISFMMSTEQPHKIIKNENLYMSYLAHSLQPYAKTLFYLPPKTDQCLVEPSSCLEEDKIKVVSQRAEPAPERGVCVSSS